MGSFLTLGEIYHPAPSILGISKNRPNKNDLDSAGIFARDILSAVDSQDILIERGISPKKGFYNLVGIIASSRILLQFLVPEPVLDRDECKKCNICKNECPVNAISSNDYPELNKNCIRCYRCLNLCPSKAYSVNWWFGDKAISVLWNRKFMSLFGEYQRE